MERGDANIALSILSADYVGLFLCTNMYGSRPTSQFAGQFQKAVLNLALHQGISKTGLDSKSDSKIVFLHPLSSTVEFIISRKENF